MRIGIIDLGTNSVRFDLHQIGPGQRIRMLHREKVMVRLGQGVFTRGRLDAGAIRRTLHAFARFHRLAKSYRAEKIVAFGTSALREARDRERLLSAIRKRTGIHVRVISGKEEAQLIALGVLSHEEAPAKGLFALADIGGGSMEISVCRGRKTLRSMSFQLGTARIQQVFLRTSPPTGEAIKRARAQIRNTLYQTMIPEKWPKVDLIIGSSGTVRALVRILGGKPRIDKTDLNALVKRMATMSTTELLGISKMESKRVDMILAGALLLQEGMDVLGARKARLTEYSLRDGILEEELRLHRSGTRSHLALHLDDLLDKAQSLGQEREHVKRVARLAEDLFDKLKPIHKLPTTWKIYLSAAVILRNTGETINIFRHPVHSYYVVKNADLPAMEEWEIDLVAELCLYHEGSKPSDRSRAQFLKLLALLRIVDSLDSGPEAHVRLISARTTKVSVKLAYAGKNLTGLEGANLSMRSRLFKRVFKRTVSVSR